MSTASPAPDEGHGPGGGRAPGGGCLWYVKASGGVWGPYPEARMAAFVDEGRVTPATAVSPFAAGPFADAGRQEEFAPLFDRPAAESAPSPAPPAPSSASSSAPAPSAALASARAAQAPGPLHPLLVWATLTTVAPAAFAAALQRYGAVRPVHAGLWLLQARVPAPALRNDLSRGLGAGDTLLVAEAPLEHAAWFNLDPAADRELRRLWAAATER